MRLGIKMLNSSSSLNQLKYQSEIKINQGDTAVVMFQLVDLDQDGEPRYIPADNFTITAKIASHNDSNVLSKTPSVAFAKDTSIFKFSLSSSDTKILGTVNLSVTLTEGSEIKSCLAESVIIPSARSPYQC